MRKESRAYTAGKKRAVFIYAKRVLCWSCGEMKKIPWDERSPHIKTFKKNGMIRKIMPFFLNEEKKLKTLYVLSEFDHGSVSSKPELEETEPCFFTLTARI